MGLLHRVDTNMCCGCIVGAGSKRRRNLGLKCLFERVLFVAPDHHPLTRLSWRRRCCIERMSIALSHLQVGPSFDQSCSSLFLLQLQLVGLWLEFHWTSARIPIRGWTRVELLKSLVERGPMTVGSASLVVSTTER